MSEEDQTTPDESDNDHDSGKAIHGSAMTESYEDHLPTPSPVSSVSDGSDSYNEEYIENDGRLAGRVRRVTRRVGGILEHWEERDSQIPDDEVVRNGIQRF